jgi:hypothetical protein
MPQKTEAFITNMWLVPAKPDSCHGNWIKIGDYMKALLLASLMIIFTTDVVNADSMMLEENSIEISVENHDPNATTVDLNKIQKNPRVEAYLLQLKSKLRRSNTVERSDRWHEGWHPLHAVVFPLLGYGVGTIPNAILSIGSALTGSVVSAGTISVLVAIPVVTASAATTFILSALTITAIERVQVNRVYAFLKSASDCSLSETQCNNTKTRLLIKAHKDFNSKNSEISLHEYSKRVMAYANEGLLFENTGNFQNLFPEMKYKKMLKILNN